MMNQNTIQRTKMPSSGQDKIIIKDKHLLRLQNANFVAFIFHTVLSLIILFLVITKGAPYQVTFTKNWEIPHISAFPAIVASPTCPLFLETYNETVLDRLPTVYRQKKNYTDVFEWFDCLQGSTKAYRGIDSDSDERIEIYDDSEKAALQQPVRNEIGRVPMWVFLIIFEAITVMFHLLLYLDQTRNIGLNYEFYLKLKIAPYRWLEYSLSSSIMIVCLLALSRVSDVYLLISTFLLSFFYNLGGGLVFELLSYLITNVIKNESVRFLAHITSYAFLVASYGAFALSFVISLDGFYSIIDPYFNLESGLLWEQLFFFIKVINIGLLTLFSLFPLVHVAQNRFYGLVPNTAKWPSYETFEFLYIVCSFLSKGLLVISIFVAALSRDD